MEVEEPEPLARRGDPVPGVVELERALPQVGDADVVAGVAEAGRLEVRAPDVHPLLVDEQAGQRVVEALRAEMRPPPVERREGPAVDGAEAEVVDADQQEVPVGMVRPRRRRSEEVRGQEDPLRRGRQRARQLDHRRGQVGVGVQVDHLLGLVEQGLEEERLHGGGELHQVVGHDELADAAPGEAQGGRAQAVDAAQLGQLVVLRHVDEQDPQDRPVLVAAQALGQGQRLGQVVRRQNGAVGAGHPP